MKKGGKTNRSGKILEYVFEQLAHYGFQEIKGNQCKQIKVFPSRYVHTHASYVTIYGTEGFHEGNIVAHSQNHNDFIQDGDHIGITIECKYQSTSGSVDEKIPYIFESFTESDLGDCLPNWILVLDGDWWSKNPRGLAVVEYAKKRALEVSNESRRFLVVSRKEFKELIIHAWGNNSANG
jgi:hypothetical protein